MTAQVHERLILDGVETSMAFCPPIPRGHPGIVDDDARDADPIVGSTACWRGYIGTWEVRDRRLWLVAVEGCARVVGEPVLADWFNGVLRIPRGEELQYVHMGFGTVFEEEVHLRVEEGRVTGRRVIDNRKRAASESDPGLPGRENRFAGDDDEAGFEPLED